MISNNDVITDIIGLHNNIQYLIKIQHLKVNEVENAIGVSIGYLSRMKNKDMPVSKVISLADYFEVTLDDLVYGTYDETYIMDQIAALQKQLDDIRSKKGETSNEDKQP